MTETSSKMTFGELNLLAKAVKNPDATLTITVDEFRYATWLRLKGCLRFIGEQNRGNIQEHVKFYRLTEQGLLRFKEEMKKK